MSKLDSYISKLLSNDDALKSFLVDPIKASEDENGLSKGQRSVLRRVVANLSNNSTNGFGIVRHLDSYRRSIRLLQNVLHLERGAAINDHGEALKSNNDKADDSYQYYTIYVYYNGDANNPQGSIYEPSRQYAYHITYISYAPVGATIETIMNAAYDRFGNRLINNYRAQQYTGGVAVTSFIIPPQYAGQGNYYAPPTDVTQRVPFWYFSVGGTALTNPYYTGYNPYSGQGGPDDTFTNYIPSNAAVANNNVIYWQCIAPDQIYGYASCVTSTVENTFEK